MAIPTSLTPSISIPQLCSVIDSAFPDLDLSTNDRDTPSPSLSSEGDPISKAYFESFPLSEAQRTILENSYAASSGFSSELDIDNPSTESPTSSMSVVDGDRVSEDGHLHAAAPDNEERNEIVKAIDVMLEGLTVKFNKVTTEIFAKLDDMALRLADLEASIKADNNESTTAGGES